MWSIIPAIIAGLGSVFKIFAPSIPTIFGDKTASNTAAAEADKASQAELQGEFSYPLGANRSTFDIIMDGVNRLPRPTLVFGMIGILFWTCISPEDATKAFVSLSLVPDSLWNIFLLIVAFYFSSRMIEKLSWGKYKVSPEAREMARRSVDSDDEPERPAPAARKPIASSQPQASMLVSSGEETPREDIMVKSGFGPGYLTKTGFTGQLPISRKAGWQNPVALQFKAE
jgi:hypothetical protein